MPKLDVRAIAMQFPAVRALDGVSLTFEPGEVHGIVGENGAGKSTLMKILAGLQQPTEGEVLLDGQAVRLDGVGDALNRGIAMIHQELNLVEPLTVAENIFLGREPKRGLFIDRKAMNEAATKLLADVGAGFAPNVLLETLPLASKQLVEIAKALSQNASILIMDEPTAVLSDPEAESLFALIRRLRTEGVTVLYISHRLVEVCDLCDRISVLRDGQWVATLPGSDATPAKLANLMVGRPLQDVFPAKNPPAAGTPVLEIRGLAVPGFVHEAALSIRPGEIVGLAGLIGAGRTELCEAIVGARKKSKGEIRVDGHAVSISSPRDAIRHGLAYVSEDRKHLGLHLELSVVHNATMANLPAYGAVLRQKDERASMERWRTDLDIRAGDVEAPIRFLSGGNQQKVSVAKWLETKPRVLILDEPTRGVDVGAKRELYHLIHRLASEGMACLVISSEQLEIVGLCHRAFIMREGRIVGELEGEAVTEEGIMRLAAGVDAA